MQNSRSGPPSDSSEAPQGDVVIAVMGSTGSGKSLFVKLLSGDENIVIGHNIDSETIDVKSHILYDENSDRKVVLVDTPGFDDSRPDVTDTDILRKITDFLLNEYDMNRKLNGLIYFQRISDPRFGGQSRRNLRMFRNLCGTKAFENVVIVTTFWDKVTNNEGTIREAQLQSTVFKDIIDGGGVLVRHDKTPDSALQVIGRIFTFKPKDVKIVEEIRKEGKDLLDTAAGSVRDKELDDAIAKHKKEVESIVAEMEAIKNSNEDLKRELEEERDNLRRELARWGAEKADLVKGLDEEKESRLQLEAAAANDREQHKRWEYEQEQRLEAQQLAHGQTLQKLQDQIADAEKKEKETRQQLGAYTVNTQDVHQEWQVRQEQMLKDQQLAQSQILQDLQNQLAVLKKYRPVGRPLAAVTKPQTNYIQGGIKLGKEIPFIPNIISVPVFGAAGLGLEMATGLRKMF